VIEKHFTLSHTAEGTDHAFSLMPEGMRKLVRDLSRIPIAIGDCDLVARSPADAGLPPYALDGLLGRALTRPLAGDEAILSSDVVGGPAHRAPCGEGIVVTTS
jgi:sialic acid synthase